MKSKRKREERRDFDLLRIHTWSDALLVDEKTISDPREGKRYVFHTTPVRRMIVVLVKGLMRLTMKTEFLGVDNLPAEGPVVLAVNHLTNFDVFPIQIAILPRPIFFMGKAELFHPLLDPLLRQLGAFPVYRGERDQWAMRHALRVLEHGQVLGMFPEGTRSKGRGLRRGKSGAARLAMQANCPLVPMAVVGTQEMFQHFPRRTPVKIQLGKPIYPQKGEKVDELTERVMRAIAAMLPAQLRGVYAD